MLEEGATEGQAGVGPMLDFLLILVQSPVPASQRTTMMRRKSDNEEITATDDSII
jgi:hypothetical protein